MLVPAALLVPLVTLFARFERPRPTLWTTAGTRTRHGLRSPSGGPDTRPGRCLLAGAGGATAATALGSATATLGLLGIAVGGIWPLPGAAGDQAGIRISPGMALVLLGTGAALLRAVGSRGE